MTGLKGKHIRVRNICGGKFFVCLHEINLRGVSTNKTIIYVGVLLNRQRKHGKETNGAKVL